MIRLLNQASQALCVSDIVTLQGLAEQLHANGTSDFSSLSESERLALATATLSFQRQVIAARGNLTLRQHLFAQATLEKTPWAP